MERPAWIFKLPIPVRNVHIHVSVAPTTFFWVQGSLLVGTPRLSCAHGSLFLVA
jgi:hypothetical protein